MAIYRCKMCGGNLETVQGSTICTCDFCGTSQTIPSVEDETLRTLFNRANVLRMKSEFDRAEEIYEKIVQTNPHESEAYWGIVLCRYGIEYVEDPATHKRIPTCHRTSYEAVTADEDYRNAIRWADPSQKEIYEAEAKAIDEIQKGILAISRNEEPYDVFICYKETDEEGKRTIDSTIGNDIYYQLTNQGYKVFYSAISLEDKIGEEYEPYIFSALNTAKVMLCLGTKPEYFQAVWVRNEWSRFLKLAKADRNRILIPCYRDMDPYELPEEFSHFQAQDMSKIGFINDLVRGIKKVISVQEPGKAGKAPAQERGAAPTDALLKRAFMCAEDSEWDKADELAERVLNSNPENADAYVAKLMIALHANRKEDLAGCRDPFDRMKEYQRAVRYGDEDLKKELQGYNDRIRNRILEETREMVEPELKEEDIPEAIAQLEKIRGWKDADDMLNFCKQKRDAFEFFHQEYDGYQERFNNRLNDLQDDLASVNADIADLKTKNGQVIVGVIFWLIGMFLLIMCLANRGAPVGYLLSLAFVIGGGTLAAVHLVKRNKLKNEKETIRRDLNTLADSARTFEQFCAERSRSGQ
ncbi:MAG: toll/interleukin-1 receptor domain-containing protein [Clostridiales bacterium]|nr:toll/interleukin-1 receptor domain-containing protein [Clostridiales bacterium]